MLIALPPKKHAGIGNKKLRLAREAVEAAEAFVEEDDASVDENALEDDSSSEAEDNLAAGEAAGWEAPALREEVEQVEFEGAGAADKLKRLLDLDEDEDEPLDELRARLEHLQRESAGNEEGVAARNEVEAMEEEWEVVHVRHMIPAVREMLQDTSDSLSSSSSGTSIPVPLSAGSGSNSDSDSNSNIP